MPSREGPWYQLAIVATSKSELVGSDMGPKAIKKREGAKPHAIGIS
jgi:hypothetical protein